MVEIGEDVVDVFDADGESDELGRNAGGKQLLLAELRVGGGRRVDRERLCVADVGEVFEELEGVDEFCSRRGTALDAEDDH